MKTRWSGSSACWRRMKTRRASATSEDPALRRAGSFFERNLLRLRNRHKLVSPRVTPRPAASGPRIFCKVRSGCRARNRTALRRGYTHGAHLKGAELVEAHFEGAILRKAHLKGTDLSTAKNLTYEQLLEACGDEKAKPPETKKVTALTSEIGPVVGNLLRECRTPRSSSPFCSVADTLR